MPRFDGTGPEGEGAMTGRRMGNCSSNTSEENIDTCPADKFARSRRNASLSLNARRGFRQGRANRRGRGRNK